MAKWDVYTFSGGRIDTIEATDFEAAQKQARLKYQRHNQLLRVYRAKVVLTGPKVPRAERLKRR